MELTWTDVQQSICRKCIDGDGRGNCRLPVDETCPLQANFSTIISTVTQTRATDYDSYVQALRQNVCATCEHQDAQGVCWKRNHLDCALDRYYPLVIDIIEYQLLLASRLA